ncbi:MAG: DNA-methyltransferase [Elusimicrobiota bacterium]
MKTNRIIHADALEGFKEIDDDSVSLIFTSPPYNLKIDYGNYEDNMPWNDYLEWLLEIWKESKRVLRSGGRLAINMATITNRQDSHKEYFRFIGKYLANQMEQINMLPFGEIIWYKQDAAGRKTAWGSWCSCSFPTIRSTHEFIYIFSKDQYRLDGDIELSDMTPEEFNKWTFSTWSIRPETRKLGGHPVPFPQELAKRVIKLFSYRGDVVLDPFSGSGTTSYVANKYGRKYLGIDNNAQYCNFAKERIKEYNDINLYNDDYISRSERLKKYKDKNKIIDSEKRMGLFD